jgi:hypothetical protein
MGREAGDDPARRYTAAIAAGVFYGLAGLAGGAVVGLLQASGWRPGAGMSFRAPRRARVRRARSPQATLAKSCHSRNLAYECKIGQ